MLRSTGRKWLTAFRPAERGGNGLALVHQGPPRWCFSFTTTLGSRLAGQRCSFLPSTPYDVAHGPDRLRFLRLKRTYGWRCSYRMGFPSAPWLSNLEKEVNLRLKGKVALVTGGASGIGEAIVRSFLAEGAATVFIDINATRGQALAEDLSSQGRCLFFAGDVAQEGDCAAAIKEAERQYGPVSILVNNAARFLFKSLEASVEEWRQSLDVNVIGASLMARYGAESMKRAGGGAIVNMGSISAFIAQSGTLTYNATKAALVGMTRCMALDLVPFKIRVNCVCPGYIMTPAYFDYVDQLGRAREEVEKELAAQTILKRLGRPEEIAGCVVFLCSEEASYVTGTCLVADGGLTAL